MTNLQTGEVYDTNLKIRDTRFEKRGYKMYNNGIITLLDVLSTNEMKILINIFQISTVDKYNIITKPFRTLTANMRPDSRSKFKKKLIENKILFEFNKKLMLNPFIFGSRGDTNIKNCKHLTQAVWTWLVDDTNKYSDDIQAHAERMFDCAF
jgi:hypothetical protein